MSGKFVDPELGLDEKSGAFLSGPPRSGELSPFAQKFAAQVLVWLCSMIVFGATADFARIGNRCNSLCVYGLLTGVFSFIFCSLILGAHWMCWAGRMDRHGWFTSAAERRLMTALVVWWGPGVGGLSAVLRNPGPPWRGAVPHTSGVGIFFGWVAFFGSIYGAYKCYHVQQEEKSYISLHQRMAVEAENDDDEYANFS